jgi:intron-binding protein aquarius
LRKHDVAFLVTLRPVQTMNYTYKHDKPFIPQVGLTYVRGCEIEGMLDEQGKVIEEGTSNGVVEIQVKGGGRECTS